MAAEITARFTMTGGGIQRVAHGLESTAERIVAKTAQDLEAGMKDRAPVDTGNLKNSIQASEIGPAHWRVTVGAEYGLYVEWGTARQRAQPFVQPTIQAVRPSFVMAMRQVAA